MLGTQLLQIGVLAVSPLRELLSLDSLSVYDGMSLAVMSLGVILVMEIYKGVRRRGAGH